MAKSGEFVFVDGQKFKLDGNGLRTPTKLERQKGLPTSIAEAKAKGLNVYQMPGQPAKIMRYKTRKKADSLGLKAEHENFETRKDNRFGKGGSGKNKRGDAEKTASPDKNVRSKANQKMARLSSRGRVGHHGLPVAYYAAGKRDAITKGGSEAGKLFDQRYGLKGGAHSVANIYDMSHPAHDKLHNVKEPAYFKSIKEAGKESDSILGRNKKVKINGNGNDRNGKNGKLKINGKGKALIGGGLLAASNFLPTKAGAEQIRDELSQGKVGDATKAYGKDLLTSQTQSRAFGKAMQTAQSKLGKMFGKKLARQALKIAGRQVVKKAGALATGPAAPIVMTSLLIKDAYDVANALSGGGLESQKVDTSNRKRLRHGRK